MQNWEVQQALRRQVQLAEEIARSYNAIAVALLDIRDMMLMDRQNRTIDEIPYTDDQRPDLKDNT